MTKKCIGIDIGQSHLRAVQMARTPDGFLIERTFGMQTRRSTDSPAGILRSLCIEHDFDRHADIVVSLPHHAIFFAETEANDARLQMLRAGDSSTLTDDFPIPAEELIAQVCSARKLPDGRHSVLVAATSTERLRDELAVFDEAKMPPTAVDTSVTAIRTTIGFTHPEMAEGTALLLHVDRSALNLIVTQDGNILMVRNIPLFLNGSETDDSLLEQVSEAVEREVEITWRKLFGSNPDAELRLYLASTPGHAEALAAAIAEKIECQIVLVDPTAQVLLAQGVEIEFPAFVAEGLALRMLGADQTDRVDFLGAYHRRTRPRWNARKQLALCGGLLVTIALIWFVNLLVQLSFLESEYGRLKTELNSVFREVLPEETTIVNPLAQIQQKLNEFDEDNELLASFGPQRLSALQTLNALSTHTPTEGDLQLRDVLLATDSVRVTGLCDSFGTVSEWQHALEETHLFETVEIQSQKKDAQTKKVHFTLLLSSVKVEM